MKRGRDTVGPPRGKHAIAFINDLNMPSPEKYGAQPPLELLRYRNNSISLLQWILVILFNHR